MAALRSMLSSSLTTVVSLASGRWSAQRLVCLPDEKTAPCHWALVFPTLLGGARTCGVSRSQAVRFSSVTQSAAARARAIGVRWHGRHAAIAGRKYCGVTGLLDEDGRAARLWRGVVV